MNCDENEPPSVKFDLTNENDFFQSMFARSIAFENTNRCKSLTTPTLYDDSEFNAFDCRSIFGDGIGKSANASPLESVSRNTTMGQLSDGALHLTQHQYLAEDDEKLRSLTLDENNGVLQSRIDFLQWQLKQTESSRRMYRVVMEQVSKFLERVHKNLDTVSTAMSTSPKTKISRFSRSRSLHTMAGSCTARTAQNKSGDKNADFANDGSRRSSPSPTPACSYDSSILSSNSTVISGADTPRTSPTSPVESFPFANPANTRETIADDSRNQRSFVSDFGFFKERTTIPTSQLAMLEKLSQESFRLLRTVHSLLNTPEPDLIHRLTPSSTGKVEESCNSRLTYSDMNSTSELSYESAASPYSRGHVTSHSLLSSPLPCARFVNECGGVTAASVGTNRTRAVNVEDESGFSSLSSFQDVNTLGIGPIGEAIVAEKENRPNLRATAASGDKRRRHQRCNSTHVHKTYEMPNTSNFCNRKEILRVLWV